MTETKPAKLERVRDLRCCCCGGATRGRPWWNRDTGYGICPECVEFARKHGETDADVRSNYGVQGIHWGVS